MPLQPPSQKSRQKGFPFCLVFAQPVLNITNPKTLLNCTSTKMLFKLTKIDPFKTSRIMNRNPPRLIRAFWAQNKQLSVLYHLGPIVAGAQKARTEEGSDRPDVTLLRIRVYKHSAAEIVQGACEGGIGTIFMFGQTGSGKTHTMPPGFDSARRGGRCPALKDRLERGFTG